MSIIGNIVGGSAYKSVVNATSSTTGTLNYTVPAGHFAIVSALGFSASTLSLVISGITVYTSGAAGGIYFPGGIYVGEGGVITLSAGGAGTLTVSYAIFEL